MGNPAVSFEFFPPKTEQMAENIFKAADDLAGLDPLFMTVTYGAGGSGRGWTMEMAQEIRKRTGIPTAAHLTCINVYKKALMGVADTFWDNDIRHIIALRGDIPAEDRPLDYSNYNYFHYSSQLVEALKDLHPAFEISVATYPEKHPDSESTDADIKALKQKCDAGADRAITQFFFENEIYYRFLEKAAQAGITVPIVPGLLPVLNFKNMLSFAEKCQARVPDWLHEKFEGLEDKPDEAQKVAEELLAAQCRDLVEHGVEHIHFYTLNKSEMLMNVCSAYRLAA